MRLSSGELAVLAGLCAALVTAGGCGGDALIDVPPPAAEQIGGGAGGEVGGGGDGGGSGGSGGSAGGQAGGGGGSGGEPSGAAVGEPCAAHASCASRLCLAGSCRAACDGQSCGADEVCSTAPIGGAARGGCVPAGAGLCQACSGDADCAFPADKCLELADGRFCGRDCALFPCPAEFECQDTGGPRQCVPKSLGCDCSAGNAGATRPCQVENGSGTCAGQERCDPARGWTGCDAATPATESCNGRDDDCDGTADDGFLTGGSCEAGVGACRRSGSYACLPDGSSGCDAVAGAPVTELCNDADDDCDGQVDEDFRAQLGGVCTVGTGGCSAQGSYACLPDGTLGCTAQGGGGSPESCNGIDDDCNGIVDDGFGLGQPCSPGTGACQRQGSIACQGGGSSGCSVVAGSPAPELCNGLDDDCNGFADDAPTDVGGGCSTGQPGICDAGTLACNGGSLACAPGTTPQAERCGDGVDQDCNGSDLPCPNTNGDGCATAVDISQGGSFAGDLTGLANDHTACRGGPNNGPDAVFFFTLAVPSLVYLDTLGAAFDSVITLESGSCGSAVQAGCLDDACSSLQTQGVIGILQPGTYWVWVDAYSGGGGAFSLTYHSSPCVGAMALTLDTFTTSGTLAVDTTGQPAAHGPTCGGGASGPEYWFYLTSCPGPHTFNADSCGATVDTVLYTRSGGCTGAELSCDDDGCGYPASRTSAVLPAAGWYWLAVDGFGGSTGASTLTWSLTSP